MTHPGNLYVIAAPSGAGKTTLVAALIKEINKLAISISHTTRAKRPNEKEGVDYHFIDEKTFKNMVNQHDFLEYAIVFDRYYGTSRQWVIDTLNKGFDVILEIDWQGYQQIKRLYNDAIGIYILPPSIEILKKRLIIRNQDDEKTIVKRLLDVKETIAHIDEFQYVVINDDFDQALFDLKTIVFAERLKVIKQIEKYSNMINEL